MVLQFFLPIIPPTITAQQKGARVSKAGKPVIFEKDEVKNARQKLQAHLAQHAPAEKLEGPLMLLVKWCFPKIRGSRNGQYKDTRPDTDNLQKLLKDAMTDVKFWSDDAQVASEHVEKFWADQPGIFIRVERLAVPPRLPQDRRKDTDPAPDTFLKF